MSNKTKPKLKNRLIIQWVRDVFKYVGDKSFTERESFRTTSIEKAERLVAIRNKKNIQFAKFYDQKGEEHIVCSNNY